MVEAEAAITRRDQLNAEIAAFEKEAAQQRMDLDETMEASRKELEEAEEKKAQAEKEYAEYRKESTGIQEQIKSLQAELKEAKEIIADSKNATVLAEAAAQEIVLNAEKQSVFLKQAALSESEKGKMLDQIEELEKQVKEKEMEKAELEKKLASLDAAVAELEKKVRSGGAGSGAPMEYIVETVEHNKSSEVNVDALSKLLKKKSAEGWTLISVVDDDGGKLISSMGGGSEAGLSSLSGSPFAQKEDRLVLIFGRPMK